MSPGPFAALDGVAAPVELEPRAPLPSARVLRAGVRSVLLNPSHVVAVFWAGGSVAVASVLPLGNWPRTSFLALVGVASLCALICAVRVGLRGRLPAWTLHVDVAIVSVLATVLAGLGSTDHVDFAELYVWVALFAALYFRPLGALAHLAGAGAAYAGLLAVGPAVPDPIAAWLSVFGTVGVAAAVVVGLVSVLRAVAREDPLTGLANRRSWDERVDEELERSRRTNEPLSLAMIDVDGFKGVNDRDGHEAGDRLLRELATLWRATVRGGGDYLARLGGDEFGLLAPGSEATGIRRLVERLKEVLPEGVACSIGVATWNGSESAHDLVRRADLAMYRVKLRHRRHGAVGRPTSPAGPPR